MLHTSFWCQGAGHGPTATKSCRQCRTGGFLGITVLGKPVVPDEPMYAAQRSTKQVNYTYMLLDVFQALATPMIGGKRASRDPTQEEFSRRSQP